MAVEAIVALMVDKLGKLLDKGGQLGVDGEIKHIRDELNKMGRFLKDADIKQKENEAVRGWMKNIRDICFDVDAVIDAIIFSQAAQGRHGFVELLKRRISDQITRYKVGKEIERIKLNIKDISSIIESYGTGKINEGGQEATSPTQRLQQGSGCSDPPKELPIPITKEDDQLIKEERTKDNNKGKGIQEASSSAPSIQADRLGSTQPGESEEVGLQEIDRVGEQLMEKDPSHFYDTFDDLDKLVSHMREREELEEQEQEPQEEQEAQAKKGFEENVINSAPRLPEVSRCSIPPPPPPPPEKIEEVITTVNDRLIYEERTRDIDEGRQEASSSSRNLQAHNPVSTLPGGPEEVGLQEEINTVGQQLIEEEPRLWDGTRDISEGKLEASSSTPVFLITLLGDSEDVGLQEGINTVGQQLIQEEPGPYDGTSDIDEGRLEASSSAPCLQADRQFSTLLGKSEEVGLKEEIDTVSEQLIKEKPSPCDGTGDIDEVPKWRYGSKKRKRQPNWSERVRVSSGPGLEGPPDDGHSWRKYGQKDILGATYPRAYYRCAHRNVTGCAAKKQVQRSEEDPSIFHVTYQGDHTCNIQSSKITGEASLLPQPFTLHQPLLGTAPLYPEKGTMKKV